MTNPETNSNSSLEALSDDMAGHIFINAAQYLAGQRDYFSASLGLNSPVHLEADRKFRLGLDEIDVATGDDLMTVEATERFIDSDRRTSVLVTEIASLAGRLIIGEKVSYEINGELSPCQRLYYSPGSMMEKLRKEKRAELKRLMLISADQA